MEGTKGKETGPLDRTDALAEIQARLERCEDDLEWVAREAQTSKRRAVSLAEEADEIERMLEDLMNPGGPDGLGTQQPEKTDKPDEAQMDALYREEEEEADRLAQSDASLRRTATRQVTPKQPQPKSRA